MSYPSQPQFTPPYGQPPQRQANNLWLIGGSVIAVLAIIMAVTLMIVQQTADSDEAGGGGETEEPTEEGTEEEPTGEETTEDDSGGDDSGGGEASGYDEATCDAYDLAPIEELFGEPADHPGGTTISSDSYGDGSGYLSCAYTTNDYDSLTVTANGYGSADSAMDTYEFDYDYWNDAEDYEVTDFDEIGDEGYHSVYGSSGSQLREIEFVVGKVLFSARVWIYTDEHDADKADEVLANFGQQAADLFADHT